MHKRVLLVDDAAFMRMICNKTLTDAGFSICGEAENGSEAISEYRLKTPDIVLMNICMPEMNGIEALKKIKEFDANAKVVMVSAMGQPGTVVESLLAGAQNFIVKPFPAELLISVVDNTVRHTRTFNMSLLRRLHSHYAANLTQQVWPQTEINEMIADLLDGNSPGAKRVESLLAQASTTPFVDEYSESEVTALFNTVIKGQDDIKALLRQLLEK